MSFLSFSARSKASASVARSGCRSSWPTSGAVAIRRLPAAAAAGTHRRDLQVRQDQPEDIKVHLERQDTLEVLEVKIEMQGETSSPNA